MNVPSANRQIARAAGTVMFAFVISNLVGLVRQILVSLEFGTQVELDAFNAAAAYPDLIFSILAGGALASAFIPTLTGFLARDDRQSGWRLSSAILNLVFIVLTVLSLISMLVAPWIVSKILTPAYNAQQQALTVALLRILLIAPAIFGVSGVLMGILSAHRNFFWSALAPSMLWLGMIIGVIFFAPAWGIFGLAWGYVLGAVLHLAIQVPAALRLPARRYVATLGLRFQPVAEVGRLMVPRLIGIAAVQVNFVVNTILATSMDVGSLAAIKYAWAVMTMPQVVIAQAIAIAALPTLSAQFALGKTDEMRSSLAATLRGMLLLALPASLGLILLRTPLISALFERGAFDAHSTELVAWALLWYTVGLLGHSVVEILSRAFYAMHDTKTPVIVSVAAMSLNVIFSLAFAALFERLGWWPFGGLALANSLATALEMVALWALMSRRLKGIEGRRLVDAAWKASLATLAMSLALWGWLQATAGLPTWLVAVGGIALGGLVYLGMVVLLRVGEVGVVLRAAKERFSKFSRR
jgi:putative peptidoglycan lipid II flippase